MLYMFLLSNIIGGFVQPGWYRYLNQLTDYIGYTTIIIYSLIYEKAMQIYDK